MIMKRSMLVALGGLLLIGITPIRGHAQEGLNMASADPGLHLGSGFGFGHRNCIPIQDVFEDLREIQTDQLALFQAVLSRDREAIAAAKAELKLDFADLQGDLRCQVSVASEDE
jgi:hypothetical protein